MKILNVSRQEVCACCIFDYRGYEISASTIFRPHSIAIFEKESKIPVCDCTSIEAAIDKINELTKEEEVG